MRKQWLLAAAIVLCAALAQHQSAIDRLPLYVLLATFAAVVGAAYTFPSPAWRSNGDDRRNLVSAEGDHAFRLVCALLAFVVPSAIATVVWLAEPYRAMHQFEHALSTWAAVAWLTGILIGVTILSTPAGRRRSHPSTWDRASIATAVVLALIVVVAATLRLWHLAGVPEGIWSDEVDSAWDAVRLQHLPFQPFPPGNSGHNPCLYFYAMSALIWALGNHIETIRLTSAFFGIAGVGVLFLLGLQIGGARLGLLSAAFFGMAQWSITFSRVAMPNIPIPAITGLGYATFIMAMHRPRPTWFAISGIMFGLSFLTYPGAYLPALAPFLVLLLRVRNDRAFARHSWPGRLFLPLCLGVTAAPFLASLILDGNYVLLRVHVTSLYNEYHDLPHRLMGLMHNIRAYLGMFTVAGDRNGRHDLPGAPMLDPVMGTLFLLGLGICLRRYKDWQSQILLLWFGSNLLSGILSVDFEAPHGARTLGSLAPICLMCALPLLMLPGATSTLSAALRAKLGPLHRQKAASLHVPAATLANVTTAAILVIALALNANRYFVQQAHDLRSWVAMAGRPAIMGRAAHDYALRGFTVYVDAGAVDDPVLLYSALPEQPRAYDFASALRRAGAGYPVAVVLPPDINALRHLLAGDAAATSVHLTPAFDRAAVEGYVVLLPAALPRT